MSRLVIALLAVAVIVAVVSAEKGGKKKCGKHEVYTPCKDQCPPTCHNPGRRMCAKATCTPGCDCAKGYLRNGKGVCVKPRKCHGGKGVGGGNQNVHAFMSSNQIF